MDTSIIESMKARLFQDVESGTATILNRHTFQKIIKCFDELQAKVGRLEKAIESFGNNPAGFDWAVLERIERLEKGLEKIKRTARKMEKKCYEGAGMSLMKSRALSIQVDIEQALKESKDGEEDTKQG